MFRSLICLIANITRAKHIKGSEKRYLLGQNNLQIFGVIPLIKPQNDT